MASDLFVSRGGEKLQAAIVNFQLSIVNLIVLDVGSSTGGFVDCLLRNGAKKVYAVDTSYGELAWKLRNNPRVVVMERTNILYLESLPEMMDLITIDAGWTKLELVLPVVRKFLKDNGIIITLLKPQYEADKQSLRDKSLKKDLIKGVLPPDLAEKVKDEVVERLQGAPEGEGYRVQNVIDSPILGGAGNKEYLLLLKT